MWSRWVGYDLAARHSPVLPRAAFLGHVDIPRLIEGGVGAQFFSLVSLPVAATGSARAVDAQIDKLDALAAGYPDRVRKATSADDVEAVAGQGTVAALLGIEGAHALEGDLDKVEHFARRGVRYLGLLHFSANLAGYPARGSGRRDDEGLTAWGRELVVRCEASRVVVDLAHINRRGFLEACEMAGRPPIVSHTGVTGAFAHWRNIDDTQLRAVADRGGAVGIVFCPRYLGGDGAAQVVRHIAHVVDVAGEDTPALGSDWDGMIVPASDLRDVSHLPRLTAEMIAAAMPERIIAKVLRENVLRVLRDVPPLVRQPQTG